MSGEQELPISPDLTPREAARRLATSEVTIWSMIADGRLPSYSLSPKRGAARRIRWEAVEAIRRGADPVEAVREADQAVSHRLNVPVAGINAISQAAGTIARTR
jgi:excisionase family DNA binding protein